MVGLEVVGLGLFWARDSWGWVVRPEVCEPEVVRLEVVLTPIVTSGIDVCGT